MLARRDAVSQIRWLSCKNANVGTIPAFGLVRVTGANGDRVLTVDKPNADSQAVLVNGPADIPAGGNGICTRDSPADVLYDTGDGTPANGDTWGAAAGSWKLRSGKTGFAIEDAAAGRAYAENNSFVPGAAANVGPFPYQYFRQLSGASGVSWFTPPGGSFSASLSLQWADGYQMAGMFNPNGQQFIGNVASSSDIGAGQLRALPHVFARTGTVPLFGFWTGGPNHFGTGAYIGIYSNIDTGSRSAYPDRLLASGLYNNTAESLLQPWGYDSGNGPTWHYVTLGTPLAVAQDQLYWFVGLGLGAGGNYLSTISCFNLFPIYGNDILYNLGAGQAPGFAGGSCLINGAFSGAPTGPFTTLPDPFPLTGSVIQPSVFIGVQMPAVFYGLSL